MINKEAREIIIEERDSLKANPMVKVEDCLYEAFDLAIKALEQTNYKSEARRWKRRYLDLKQRIFKLEEQTRWIPIKTRPLTEEEKEHYISIGWSEDSLEFIYNCPLPDDGQEVWITDSMGNVELDTFYSDDGCYFENNCDADEVIAWMPKPQPYKESDKNAKLD